MKSTNNPSHLQGIVAIGAFFRLTFFNKKIVRVRVRNDIPMVDVLAVLLSVLLVCVPWFVRIYIRFSVKVFRKFTETINGRKEFATIPSLHLPNIIGITTLICTKLFPIYLLLKIIW